jgi:hypothetical protein
LYRYYTGTGKCVKVKTGAEGIGVSQKRRREEKGREE